MDWFKKMFQKNSKAVIIVSGLPRSGTSMMMSMLAAGGIEPLADGIRQADENNPRGYFEFERVKKMKDGDFAWLQGAQGKAVKVISALLEQLPRAYHYKIIFMRRDMNEILASQKAMLARNGKPTDKVSDEELAGLYETHLQQIEVWLAEQRHFDVVYVDYNTILQDPEPHLAQVNRLLGGGLDLEAMRGVVDQSLYRERNG